MQAGGQRFESVILHKIEKEHIDILEAENSEMNSKVNHEQIKNRNIEYNEATSVLWLRPRGVKAE